MKLLLLAFLCLTPSCSIFKAKDVVSDTEKLATDVSKLEQDASPDVKLVIADGQKIVQDMKS